MFDISDRRVVVTGAGGALCGAISEGLARLGAKVAIVDRDGAAAKNRAESIAGTGGTSAAFACDVTNEDDLLGAYARICELWGGVDLLLNGAGGNDPKGSTENEYLEAADLEGANLDRGGAQDFFTMPFDGVRRTFDVNFFGTWLAARAFSRGMVERQDGSIVNISSMSALTPLTKVGAYSAAKAAVANFTKWLAVHFSHCGVRVNAIAPGFFMTEQLRFLHIDRSTGDYTPRAKKVVARTPMGRYGEPDELIGTVVWLFSNASRFVTGNVVPIDGGFSSYAV